ncbi:MAG: carbohydrate ABC transporter permease [Clostridia bacterium]|nr:carbohydrate ABC transporter permease [Clostridia bacterium]
MKHRDFRSRRSNHIQQTHSDTIFISIVLIFIIILVFLCLFPFLNIVSVSLSSRGAVMSNGVGLWPVEFDITAYKVVFNNHLMVRSLWFTILLTVVFVGLTMGMTVMTAYPLARKDLKGRNIILLYIIFTMYFSGGMIPGYLNIKELGLLNSFWSLVLPGLISTYNMILMKTFFSSLPEELEESARIDGAGEFTILVRIILPLSKAMLATIALFYAVSRWNGFSDSVLYINDSRMYTLQLRLRQIVALNQSDEMINDTPEAKASLIPETVKAACLVFSMLPILVIYPWLQKYFVKGVMIGSVKG